MPNLMPQGSGSILAEAGVTPTALKPAIPAAPRKLRREVSIFIVPFLRYPPILLRRRNSVRADTSSRAQWRVMELLLHLALDVHGQDRREKAASPLRSPTCQRRIRLSSAFIRTGWR